MKKIRIINKSDKGVTLTNGNKKVFLTWDEFNKIYTIENNIYAILKPEEEKRLKELNELIYDAITSYMIVNSLENCIPGSEQSINKLRHFSILGDRVNRIASLLDCSESMACDIIRDELNRVTKDMNKNLSRNVKPKFDSSKYKNHEAKHSPKLTASFKLGDIKALSDIKNNFKK